MTISYLRSGVGVVVGLVLCSGLASCGLISSDVTNFDLTLPDKKFTIDTTGWQVDSSKASAFMEMSCASRPALCSTAVQEACMTGCSGSCNEMQTCDLSLDISLMETVDLVAEKPELRSINDQPLIKVEIDSVTYEVTSNTLNVDTPELTVYVAPITTLKPAAGDADVKAIGTIAPVPAGWVTEHTEELKFTSTGKAELVKIMSSFKTPFNVLVGSSLVVTRGQPVPTGKLEAVVYIRGHAGL